MRKLTQRFIGFFMILAVLIMSIMVNVPTAEASLYPELKYTFDSGIPDRTIITDASVNTEEIQFKVNGMYFPININPDRIINAYCDSYGTLWLMSDLHEETGFAMYWYNYELEGSKNISPHYFNNGAFHIAIDSWVDGYFNTITGERFSLPTLDELKNYLENDTPVPGSKPEPIKDPDSSTNPAPTPQTSTIKISGNTIKLIKHNKVVDKATFNKKKSTLSYRGNKVTNVKGVWFTEKGKVVYIKGSKQKYKAYYFDGKKSTLIKSGVSSVDTKNKFATALKLKNGKTYQLK